MLNFGQTRKKEPTKAVRNAPVVPRTPRKCRERRTISATVRSEATARLHAPHVVPDIVPRGADRMAHAPAANCVDLVLVRDRPLQPAQCDNAVSTNGFNLLAPFVDWAQASSSFGRLGSLPGL